MKQVATRGETGEEARRRALWRRRAVFVIVCLEDGYELQASERWLGKERTHQRWTFQTAAQALRALRRAMIGSRS